MYLDYRLTPLNLDFASLKVLFRLRSYETGIQLQFPSPWVPPSDYPVFRQETYSLDYPKLFILMKESENWARLHQCETIPKLNAIVRDKAAITRLIEADEADHERRFSEAAALIVCLIASLYSSTLAYFIFIRPQFSLRSVLCVCQVALPVARQPRVRGWPCIWSVWESSRCPSALTLFIVPMNLLASPVPVSQTHTCTHTYAHTRPQVPVDENGKKDYECVEAVDLECLADRLKRLVAGEVLQYSAAMYLLFRRASDLIIFVKFPDDSRT